MAEETGQGGATADEVHLRDPEFFAPTEVDAGILVPVQQYALIETRCGWPRRPKSTSNAAGRLAVGALQRGRPEQPPGRLPRPAIGGGHCRAGGGQPPHGLALQQVARQPDDGGPGGGADRVLAEAARRHRVPEDRWIFPLVGVDADHAVSLSRRRWLHRWPAMQVLGQAAEARTGRPLADAEFTEVYSCFPSAVRVQQRELGLALEDTPTLTGGMTFAGGPFNNFVYQATAAMVPRLRAAAGALGVVTTVCGFLTKPGLAVWSARPDGRPPLLSDLAAEAALATPTVAVATDHRGPARLASYTVVQDADGPSRLVGLCDLPDGRRHVATADDRDLAAAALTTDLMGAEVAVEDGTVKGVTTTR